jgi:hypothetical protein
MSYDSADEGFVHERYSKKAFDQMYVPDPSKLPYKKSQTLSGPRKGQCKLGKLRIKNKTAPEIWNAVLTA